MRRLYCGTELVKLPGFGRKTVNVVLGDALRADESRLRYRDSARCP